MLRRSPAWLAASRLWLVLDRAAAAPRSLAQVTQLGHAGGVDAVLCRLKGDPPALLRRTAREIREMARSLGLPFIMSHEVALAVELEADGVQLGLSDPPLTAIRPQLPPDIVLGYSTHSPGEAARQLEQGADYVFLGPIFPTPAKLKYGAPLGFAAVRAAAGLPGVVVFIGGITTANASLIVEHGGRRVAAISALQQVGDPAAAARELKALLPE